MFDNHLLPRMLKTISMILLIGAAIAPANTLAFQSAGSFEQARMAFDGETLVVDTGVVTRKWKVTKKGLATASIQLRGQELCSDEAQKKGACDWDLGVLTDAELVSLSAEKGNDDGFTSDHLRVEAEFLYRREKVMLKYVVWAYPQSSGLRTQLMLKAMTGFDPSLGNFQSQVVESLKLSIPWSTRHAFGLMQGIKTNMKKKILREKNVSGLTGNINWANGIVTSGENGGVTLVKESNKHTALRKADDVATGGFVLDGPRITVAGGGVDRADLNEIAYVKCWATWLVLHDGDEWSRNLSLKKFDRLRYPIDPQRDIYIMANTWGTEDLRPPCLHAAREENVLRELESVADLGIDVLQIDDGWQTPNWMPAASAADVQRGKEAVAAFGDYSVYPDGWVRVRKKADQLGVTLGLWAAWTAPTAALQSNYDQGDFKYFKLDFARLNTRKRFDDLSQKARELIKHSGYTARVNWDVTEVAARMGYFCGREYGNIYLENRKIKTVRRPVLYVPHKVLSDAWHLSKYVNLNKFQVTVQNIDEVPVEADTDAAQHTHDYAVGIALMSSPIFFQETRHYLPPARERIRKLLAVYKAHRQRMFAGYVFPIGSEPNNGSWTGFQNYEPNAQNGYVTVFRELHNDSSRQTLNLHFLAGRKIQITNLLTGQRKPQRLGPKGELDLEIPEAPGFLFLRYESIGSTNYSQVSECQSIERERNGVTELSGRYSSIAGLTGWPVDDHDIIGLLTPQNHTPTE